jgi:hypothetical protein
MPCSLKDHQLHPTQEVQTLCFLPECFTGAEARHGNGVLGTEMHGLTGWQVKDEWLGNKTALSKNTHTHAQTHADTHADTIIHIPAAMSPVNSNTA